jgi:hypothetical protein
VSSAAAHTTNFALGYTAIDGGRALVGTTGTFCSPEATPKCITNDDPVAVLSSGKSFSTLWNETIHSTGGYSLVPCIKVGGKWYLDAQP